MLLAAPIVVLLALVPLGGGRLSALVDLRFRRPWLLWAALGLQLFLFMPGGPAWPAAHLVSYALGGAFAWHNRHIPYLWLLCLGGALNLAAITANGGTMPARRAAEVAAGLTDAGPANSSVLAHPHLALLGDVFAIPASWPLHNVFSVGDVILVVGAGLLMHCVTGSRWSALPRWATWCRARSGRPDGRGARSASTASATMSPADDPRTSDASLDSIRHHAADNAGARRVRPAGAAPSG